MLDWLEENAHHFIPAMIYTIGAGIVSFLSWTFLPSHAAFFSAFAFYIALWAWHYAYDTWVENCLHSQTQETLGRKAIVIQARLAVAGALAVILLVFMSGILLNRDLGSPVFKICSGLAILAVPASFFSHHIRYGLINILREMCLLPINIMIAFTAITRSEHLLNQEFKRINAIATKVFALISGYPSNLSMLHKTDYILKHLPKQQ